MEGELQLSDLFAEGSAPERDPAFTLLVASEIGGARLRRHLLALGLRMTALLVLSVPVFLAGRLIAAAVESVAAPVLARLVEGWPRFMDVPVPVVLGVLLAALLLRSRLYLFPRPSGLLTRSGP